MAITLGSGPATVADGNSTHVLSLTGTTAGRSIVVGLVWSSSSATISSITCSGESNLTVHGSPAVNSTSGRSAQFASLANITTGGTKTITITLSSTVGCSAFAYELVGADTSSLFDASNGGSGNSTNPSINLTTASASAAIFAIVNVDSGTESTAGGSHTGFDVPNWDGTTYAEYLLDAGTAGSKTVNFTNAASAQWVEAALSVKLLNLSPTITPLNGTLVFSGSSPNVSNSSAPTIRPTAGALSLTGTTALVSPMTTTLAGTLQLTGAGARVAVNGPVAFEELIAFGVGTAGTLGTGTATFELFTATGTGENPFSGSGAAVFEQLSAEGSWPNTIIASFEAMTASGTTGVYGTGSAIFKPLGTANAIIVAAFEQILATGYGAPAQSSTFRTFSMNTRNYGVSEFQSFPFNSYALVNGRYLGASSDGLFALDGSTDNNSDIAWKIRTGQLDADDPGLKRLPEILLGLRINGPIRVRVWYNDDQYFDYILPRVNVSTLNQARVKLGKGMRSRYFSVELQGISNSAMELDSLQLPFTKTTRRIG